MKIKVCGMGREPEKVNSVALLGVDYIGFIFYTGSPRNVGDMTSEITGSLPQGVKPVGVFVNASKEEILRIVDKYIFKTVQLHGNETPEFCMSLRQKGLEVIKAIRVPEAVSANFFSGLKEYEGHVDLFLFDTAGKKAGGNGIKFDWDILKDYDLDIPYLLSGGISPQDAELLKGNLPKKCMGIDINSKFEYSPGIKDMDKLECFITQLRL